MPFKSKAQAGYMFAKHPEMAKEWAAHTPNMKALPKHAGEHNKMKRHALLAQMKGH